MVKVFFAETFQISFRSPASTKSLQGVCGVQRHTGEWPLAHTPNQTHDRHEDEGGQQPTVSQWVSAALLSRSCLTDGTNSISWRFFRPALNVLDSLILGSPSCCIIQLCIFQLSNRGYAWYEWMATMEMGPIMLKMDNPPPPLAEPVGYNLHWHIHLIHFCFFCMPLDLCVIVLW